MFGNINDYLGESIHVIDYMGYARIYDIQGEQETSSLFDVLPYFVPLIDNEASYICLHESDIDMVVPSDEIVEINSSTM